MIRVASFDIGKKNFAFCIEEFNKDELGELEKIEEYNKDGTPTPEMENVLDQLYMNGTIILHINADLTKDCDKNQKLDPKTFLNMNDLLEEHAEVFDTCDYFVIEEQMAFGAKVNKMALKLGQHCFSYFTIKYHSDIRDGLKEVIEFPAYHKTQVLGCEKEAGKQYKNGNTRWKAISKPKRKKWAVNRTIEILETRNEKNVLKDAKKKDDLADTFLQLQAFKFLTFVKN